MTTVRVVPALTTIANNPNHPATIVGDPTMLWGDSDDGTYVEFWRSAVTDTGGAGGSATGFTPPQAALTLDAATLYARLELFDDGNATATGGVYVDVQRASDGRYLGEFAPVTQPATLGVIVDITDWTFDEAYPGALGDMGAAVPDGLQLILSRGGAGEIVPAPWGYGLRAFELNLLLTSTAVATPRPYRARQRLYPIAPARRWPREAWTGSSSRRVGGYR